MGIKKEIFEFDVQFRVNGRVMKVQQSALTFRDAKARIKRAYPHATHFKLLRKARYPHRIK